MLATTPALQAMVMSPGVQLEERNRTKKGEKVGDQNSIGMHSLAFGRLFPSEGEEQQARNHVEEGVRGGRELTFSTECCEMLGPRSVLGKEREDVRGAGVRV